MKWRHGMFAALLLILTLSATADTDKHHYSPNFQVALRVVLKHEGRLSNDRNDPGGITNYGISLRFLKDEHIDINHDGRIDKNDIIHLTESEADSIYLNDWWDKYRYYKIWNSDIATKIMDGSVNMGHCRAHKIVYMALNQLVKQPLPVQCELTDLAYTVINAQYAPDLHAKISMREMDFYQAIVNHNHNLKGFLNGWTQRAMD